MSAPNKGKSYKRLSINLTEELDEAVVRLRSQKEFVRCSYVECIRILLAEGAKAMADRYQNSGGKS